MVVPTASKPPEVPARIPEIVAPSAPGVSAPLLPLVVPLPLRTLPLSGPKVPAATLSASLRAIGMSSTILIVNLAVAKSPSGSVTATVNTSEVESPEVLSVRR